MPGSVKPFDFSNLKSLTAAESALWEILYSYGADKDFVGGLLPQLAKALQEVTREDCSLHFQGLHLEDFSSWQGRLAGEGVYAIISAGPSSEKAVLLFDSVFALSLIDLLLGGDNPNITTGRRLSEIEEGVMSYLLARLLQAFSGFTGSERGHFRLEKIYGSRDSLVPFLEGVATVALVDLHVSLYEVSGVVQLALPDLFIQKEISAALPSGVDQKRQEDRRASHLQALGDLSYPLLASVGSATLTEDQLLTLEPGDIVLIDNPQCRFCEGRLEGELMLVSLLGDGPKFLASVQAAGPTAQLAIKEIYQEA